MVSIRGCCFKEFRISRLSQLGFSLLRFNLAFVGYGAMAHSLRTQSANPTVQLIPCFMMKQLGIAGLAGLAG